MIFLCSLYELYFNKYKLYKLEKIIYIILFLVTALRYDNGSDFRNYYEIFKNINVMDSNYLEYIFVKVVKLNNLFFNFNFNFILMSGINHIILYYGMRKVKYRFIGLFIYLNVFFLPYSFNAMRQSISMACFLIFVLYNNFWKKIISFIIAIGFHKISFYIFILYFFVEKIKPKLKISVIKKVNYLIMPIFFIGLLFSNKITLFLSNYINKLKIFIEKDFALSISGLILRIMLIGIILFYYKKLRNTKLNIYIFYVIGFLLYGILYSEYMFNTRINMFTRTLEMIIIPEILYKINSRTSKNLIFIIIILILSTVYVKEINLDVNKPYKLNYEILNGDRK